MLYEKILIQRDINYMSQFLPLNKSLKYNKQRGQFNRNNLAIFDDGHSTEDFIGRTTGTLLNLYYHTYVCIYVHKDH